MHGFIHTLETIPQNKYLEIELSHGTANWEEMIDGFILTFSFEDDCPYIDSALQIVKKKIFENEIPLTWKPDWVVQLQNVLECYNIIVEQDENPHNIDISESKGYHKVNGLKLEMHDITQSH